MNIRSTGNTNTGTYAQYVRIRSRGLSTSGSTLPGLTGYPGMTRASSRDMRYACPRCPKIYRSPDHVRRHLVNFHEVPRSDQGPIQKYVVND